MSGTLTLALRTAQSGLLTNQRALNVTGINIANVNTEGYSRKIVNFEQRVVGGAGAGVQISEIGRQVNEGLLKSLRLEFGALNDLNVRTPFFDRLQDLFGQPADNTSISHVLGDFTSALETLALSPESSLSHSEVIVRATDLTNKFKQMSDTIQDLRQQADQEIGSIVTEINDLISRIGGFNDTIISSKSTGRDVTDLMDQRDAAVDRLSELIDIRFFKRSDGDIVVFTSGGRTLVDNVPAKLTHSVASTVSPAITQASGEISGIFVGTAIAGNDITTEIRSGKLKGLIDLRDDILPNMQSQMDELATEVRDVFNQIHNRGVPFPGMQSMTGTRAFVAPATQTITFSGNDDTTLAVFDNNGDQVATTTMRTLLGGAGPFTINAVASAIQTWLQGSAVGATSATAAVTNGSLAINLNSTSLNLAFRDETATTAGSSQKDAGIQFDANGDGSIDQTVQGFSNFFGLNDFFVDGLPENLYESNVLSSTFVATAATLSFRDSTGAIGTVAISAGTSLKGIADAINNTGGIGVTASVVPDGSGFRLRIAHNKGASVVVTQNVAGGDTLLTDIGMHVADVRVAQSLSVRADIVSTPARISRGQVQWDANLGVAGQYLTSVGDDSIAGALTTAFTQVNTFDSAGGIAGFNATFGDYAASIISRNASLADDNARLLQDKQSLVDSLKLKSDSTRGVNLDEELSNLILFEQAYSASARMIAVVQNMFDALERAVS